jgi:putative endonuclease
MNQKYYYVYIMASKRNGTLYVGMTDNLPKRVLEHKQKIGSIFTRKYDVNRLVYYEVFGSVQVAYERERKLKRWRRKWKLELIESMNPNWGDLFDGL